MSPRKFIDSKLENLNQINCDLSKINNAKSIKSTKNHSEKHTNYDSDNIKVTKNEMSNRSLYSLKGQNQKLFKLTYNNNEDEISKSLSNVYQKEKKNFKNYSKQLINSSSLERFKSPATSKFSSESKQRNKKNFIPMMKDYSSLSTVYKPKIEPQQSIIKNKNNKSMTICKKTIDKPLNTKSNSKSKTENGSSKNIKKLKNENSHLILDTLKKLPNIKKTLEKNLKRPLSAGIFN